MGGLINAVQLILALSILVAVHEFGHFIAARMFGIRVDKFYIFFDAYGKKLWSKKIGDTEYGIGWLPLGGYVKIAGMIDESMDKEAMKQPPKDDEFRSKPAWQRFIVMIGGIVMNIILGVIIFAGLNKIGQKEYINPSSMEQGVVAHELGKQLGFQTGDKIVAFNGKPAQRWKDVNGLMLRLGAEVTVDRNGKEITLSLPDTLLNDRRPIYGRFASVSIDSVMDKTLETGDKKTRITSNYGIVKKGDKIIAVNGNELGNFSDLSEVFNKNKNEEVNLLIERNNQKMPVAVQLDTAGRVGFFPKVDYTDNVEKVPYTWGSALMFGAKEGFTTIYSQILAFGQMFRGKLPVVENMQSPIGIAKYFGGHWSWLRFWTLTGLISFVLAFMNILPIPALDGGHMMFLSWEMITGKALSDKFLERAQMVGMAILLPLMLLILLKDVWVDIISKFF